jgi:hypothetical protein
VRALTLITLAFLVWMIFAVASVRGEPGITTTPEGDPVPPSAISPLVVNDFELSTLRKRVEAEQHRAATEHRRYLAAHKRVKQLTRTLQHHSTVSEAINLACMVYGSCSTLWRRASCESGFYTRARNPSGASGLFQFLPSTWDGTPFSSFSIWSPYAQALAAGWMQANGRGSEWVCR